MKKMMSKMLLSTIVLGGIAGTGVSIFADENGAVYMSNGQIEFTSSDDITDPVDPDDPDPTNPVNPIDPTDPENPVDPGTKGPLSIDYASSFDFGKQKITSSDQKYNASVQKYKDEGKNSSDNYVQVTDNRGTLAGWKLQVAQPDPFTSEKNSLLGTQIVIKNAEMRSVAESQEGVSTTKEIIIEPGTGNSDVMSAVKDSGAGTYVAVFIGDKSFEENDREVTTGVQLKVPGKATKYKTTYKTTLNWTLSDVPGNGTDDGSIEE